MGVILTFVLIVGCVLHSWAEKKKSRKEKTWENKSYGIHFPLEVKCSHDKDLRRMWTLRLWMTTIYRAVRWHVKCERVRDTSLHINVVCRIRRIASWLCKFFCCEVNSGSFDSYSTQQHVSLIDIQIGQRQVSRLSLAWGEAWQVLAIEFGDLGQHVYHNIWYLQ